MDYIGVIGIPESKNIIIQPGGDWNPGQGEQKIDDLGVPLFWKHPYGVFDTV